MRADVPARTAERSGGRADRSRASAGENPSTIHARNCTGSDGSEKKKTAAAAVAANPALRLRTQRVSRQGGLSSGEQEMAQLLASSARFTSERGI